MRATLSEGITGITGSEGSGKTCLMTCFCLNNYRRGQEIFTFPGYTLKDKGKIVSKTIMPEEWVSLPDSLRGITLAIDEADTFFNSLEFGTVISKLFQNFCKQRRKRHMTIVYTVQDWSWFNNRLRWLTHTQFECWDLYWTYRNKEESCPRGTSIVITPIDCKGFFTGIPGKRGNKVQFNASKYWENYDTEEITDAISNMVHVKVKRREVNIVDGQVMPETAHSLFNPELIERYAEEHLPVDHQSTIKNLVDTLKKKRIESIPKDIIWNMISKQGVNLSKKMMGSILLKNGMRLQKGYQGKDRYEFA
jgi:GTPase SAR1 family protein